MEKFKIICSKILECLPSSSKIELDRRFAASLVTIDNEDIETVKNNLEGFFENKWDSSSIKKASKPEKKLVKNFSGLQSGQILFTAIDENMILFGAWWPWGDNSKVSLRIGFFSLNDKLDEEDVIKHLTEWFSL